MAQASCRSNSRPCCSVTDWVRGNQIVNTLSEAGYAILRDAVNVARDFQCQSLAALKSRLTMRWSGQELEITEAITFWANSVRERHPGGVPRT